MLARELMTSDPFVVTPEDTIARAAEIMRDHDVGIVPVIDDRRGRQLLGVLTDRDISIRCVARNHSPDCLVKAHMTTTPLHTVYPDDDVEQVLAVMEHDQIRRILVVSEGNRLEGIIAQADLARKVGPKQPLKVEEVLERVCAPASAEV